MNYNTIIRKLARSVYWLNLFTMAKTIGTIQMFENNTNYSGLQIQLLYWLRVYDMIHELIGEKKYSFLDEAVINDDVRTDAFLYFYSQQREKELQDLRHKEKIHDCNFKKEGRTTTFEVDFGSK